MSRLIYSCIALRIGTKHTLASAIVYECINTPLYTHTHTQKKKKKKSLPEKVDKKAMIRNRYNRIPYPALNTKRERDTYN